ncbi:hypothetical protein N7516_004107 [Penicillium verrucosum]|uniref:uncharacterized protein n=1 Tax=Penicillium verrucosum TaxID=60171 RepID=UPI002544F849|nr:uncharacterized protein N7516_004107 [Penicillium verrucosum]KAJ5943939.1 hypothetical protein N7516_004107 [Penicillium verrucosum]
MDMRKRRQIISFGNDVKQLQHHPHPDSVNFHHSMRPFASSHERNFMLCFAAASKGQQMCIIGLENALHFLLTSGALEQCRKTNVP